MRLAARTPSVPAVQGDVTVELELGRPAAEQQIPEAVRACHACHGRLRLLCRVPRASRWCALAGIDPAQIEAQLVADATALLRRCLELVPDDLPTTTQLRFA